jgi:hypothetical protein
VELSEYVLEPLRKDEEFVLYRSWHSDQPISPSVLQLAFASTSPTQETLRKIEHEYSLTAELESLRLNRNCRTVNSSSRSVTRAWGCQRSRWIRSFLRSLPPSRRAAAWGWPSAVPLWSRMAGSCGQAPTVEEAQLFISPYRSRSPSHRPWSPETLLRLPIFPILHGRGIGDTRDCSGPKLLAFRRL